MMVYPYMGEQLNSYTYSSSRWGDLLTNYDGTEISYDALGNPLNWRNAQGLHWNGRQLKSFTTDAGTRGVQFSYNADGIRTYKSHYSHGDMNMYHINYVLDGTKILAETYTHNVTGKTYTLYYFYDEKGDVAGFEYNGSAYYYQKNIQGDILRICNESGSIVAEYTYDTWGKVLSVKDSKGNAITDATHVANLNPFRYRSYYYDTETGFYYLNSRYYDPEVGRFLNADDTAYLGADGSFLSYNLFAYCGNNPITGYDPDGTWDWGNFLRGSSWIATGIAAIAVGVSVLTCGVAAPAMIAIATVTVTAGVATTVNGVSEIGEAATGHNFMRDDVFQGNSTAYNAYAYSTATISQIGTIICGDWLKTNQTKIADHKLEEIIKNPESVNKYSTKQFEKIAKQSSWECGVSANGKGFRAYTGNYSIRYNLNGTRLDQAHFFGNPYWVVSSASKGSVKVPF